MAKPVAVLISDVHYNVNTISLADAAMRMAINKANELSVPLIVAGDLHDTKANLRGECINAMLETFRYAKTEVIILVGNHDKINEKSEDNSLNFLEHCANIVKVPLEYKGRWYLPYQHDLEVLQNTLSQIPAGSTIICHQGVHSANMGHYVQDKTSLPTASFADYRVISGHYHTRQDIKCGRPKKGAVGLFSYIGNPYTLTFGEANDPEKGFQILVDDGLLEFVPTNLRRHRVVECKWNEVSWLNSERSPHTFYTTDLLWLKVSGPHSELKKLNKKAIGESLIGHSNYKLDLIATDASQIEEKTDALKDTQILDMLIESMGETKEQSEYLKKLWRDIL